MARHRANLRALALAVTFACTACSARPTVVATPTVSVSASPSASPAATAQSPSPTPTATLECAAQTLAAMTEDQRIGQLFLLGLANDQLGVAETNAIRAQHFGSVWFVEQSRSGVASIRAVADAVQALADPSTTANVRFFVAANQEGGLIQSLSGPGFTAVPSALEQSGVDPAALRAQAAQWGRQLMSAGVNLNFAPVLDVVPPGTDAQNEPIGVLQRGYGHDPATVSAHGLAFMSGMDDAGVATTAKHFPGLGRVKGNTDFTATVVDTETTSTDPYLAPFRDVRDGGARDV